MAKTESTFINMVLVLTLVAVVAGLALGTVYSITKEPIALSKKKKIEKAIKQVLPEFDKIDKQYKVMSFDGSSPKDSLSFFVASKDGKWVGTAVNTYTNKGFSGLVKLMVGFRPDGTINNISVLDHKETPGLGSKMSSPKFKNQFEGKHPKSYKLVVSKDGGDVDAITAATISSRAFCDAALRAYKTFETTKGGQE